MRIRQEVWTPSTHWKTVLSHGELNQSGVVFCFGNPGQHNAQAIYNEVRHSFPGADLIFGFLDESHEERLYLTAFESDRTEFICDQVSLNDLNEDSKEISDRFEEKKWNGMMMGIDADKNYAAGVIHQLETSFGGSFSQIKTQIPSHRIRLGLNSMPTYNRAISLATTGNGFSISLSQKKKAASGGAAAAQTMWDRYAGSILSKNEAYTFYFPIAMMSC